jgi:thiamine pyrophosphate-dependent acetolactate synthase large subunit-like protein
VNVAELIVQSLRTLSVRHLFGYPGDPSVEVLEAARRNDPSWGTLIEPTDLEKLAQSMGCDGVMVDSAAALERVLGEKRAAGRPLVVGAKIDPAQYAAQF